MTLTFFSFLTTFHSYFLLVFLSLLFFFSFFLPSCIPSFIPFFIPSFLPSFFPDCLPSFLPYLFISFFLPSFLPFFLPFLLFFLPSLLPSFFSFPSCIFTDRTLFFFLPSFLETPIFKLNVSPFLMFFLIFDILLITEVVRQLNQCWVFSVKSPQQIMGSLVKSFMPHQRNINPSRSSSNQLISQSISFMVLLQTITFFLVIIH